MKLLGGIVGFILSLSFVFPPLGYIRMLCDAKYVKEVRYNTGGKSFYVFEDGTGKWMKADIPDHVVCTR